MNVKFKKKIAYSFFVISVLLLLAFFRQQMLVMNHEVWVGAFTDYKCETRLRGDKLTIYLKKPEGGVLRYVKSGQSCYKFSDFEKYFGRLATIKTPKGSNLILNLEIDDRQFINRKNNLVSRVIGLIVLIGTPLIIGVVILRSSNRESITKRSQAQE